MKKVALFLVFAVVLSILPAASFAATPQAKIITFKEIKDEKLLWQRAINGVSDLANEKNVKEVVLTNNQTQKTEKVKAYSTTQLLQVKKYESGKEERLYKQQLSLL